MLFLPRDAARRATCEAEFAALVRAEGQTLLGWRDVPTDNRELGATAVTSEPVMRQVFIGRGPGLPESADGLAFERKLFVLRRLAESRIAGDSDGADVFYVASLSCRTIVYKGMLLAEQLRPYFRRPGRSALRFGHRPRPLPLQHQHLSGLEARPPQPLSDPQRRDQHHQGQRQRHEGAPGAIPLGGVW
jgi:glutamate synthase domain-containing protein 1